MMSGCHVIHSLTLFYLVVWYVLICHTAKGLGRQVIVVSTICMEIYFKLMDHHRLRW